MNHEIISLFRPYQGQLDNILKGMVPREWEEDQTWSSQMILDQGIAQIKAVVESKGINVSKKESPEAYAFEMESNFELTRSMKADGWAQFHTSVDTLALFNEEPEPGVKLKKYRIPVHAWVSPDGKNIVFAKMKCEGKDMGALIAHTRKLLMSQLVEYDQMDYDDFESGAEMGLCLSIRANIDSLKALGVPSDEIPN